MNWFDWTILGAVVVLWLRLEVLFHKVDVLDAEFVSRLADLDTRFSQSLGRINARLDKLDPPLRRATDKKKAKR